MQFAVITVARKPPYVLDTVAGLRHSEPTADIDVFVGSPDTSDVAPLRGDPWVRVHEIAPALWQRIQPLTASRRAAGNFLQALRSQPTEDVLLLEDDIVFKPGWREALDEGRALCPDALITLYVADPMAPYIVAPSEGRWCTAFTVMFYGTLGFFVPAGLRQRLADFVDAELTTSKSFDGMIVEFVQRHRIRFATSTTSWIDHRGDVTSIPENEWHGIRRAARW